MLLLYKNFSLPFFEIKNSKMQNKKQKSSNPLTPSLMRRAGVRLIVFAYITTKNKSEAKKIGKILLQEKLAACVNIFNNTSSMYCWKGNVKEVNESVLIAKTSQKLFSKLTKQVKAIHSYSMPCILQIPITDGDKEYVDWLLSNLK
jgi:periplasmic divalent cation tolerance protein